MVQVDHKWSTEDFRRSTDKMLQDTHTFCVFCESVCVLNYLIRKLRNRLDNNKRGVVKLRLNKTFACNYDFMCDKHQEQGSH